MNKKFYPCKKKCELRRLKQHILIPFSSLFFSVFLISMPTLTSANNDYLDALANAALKRTEQNIVYNGRYFKIDFPNGDVPKNIGVCTDVVIRSYRALGVDLQKLVHDDIQQHFDRYPAKRIWGQSKPDTNIDHRRVPNLATFFSRHGETLSKSNNPSDYQAGDIVTWKLENNLPHIGIVANKKGTSGNPLIIHNIGAGPKLEDALFSYTITGHFRYIYQAQNDTIPPATINAPH